jgi:hypothetical protein
LEKLQAMVESVIQTHNPTWEDCQQLLQTLFNMEEKRCILVGAHQYLEGNIWEGVADPATWVRTAAPGNDRHGTLPLKKEEGTYASIRGPFCKGYRQKPGSQ